MAMDVKDTTFDLEDYAKAADRLTAAYQVLPEGSVRELAEEALRRMAMQCPPDKGTTPFLMFDEEIDELCHALTSPDLETGAIFSGDLMAMGVSLEDLYLRYFSAAARRLGEWWQNDQVSFVDVTIATGRMMAIIHALAQSRQRSIPIENKAAVFVVVPGETHTFGANIASDLLRQEGWDITLLAGLSHEDLVEKISASDIQLIGVSAGGDHAAAAFLRLMHALRICKPNSRIIVSGGIVELCEDLVKGALPDGIAHSFKDAQSLMDRFTYAAIKPR